MGFMRYEDVYNTRNERLETDFDAARVLST